MLLPPETEVGTFEIVRLLGEGGVGEVYLARDRRLNRFVAIKVLHADAMEPNRLARFEVEARAASMLSHPNICHIYELGDMPDGRRFIAMEHVEGELLHQRMLQRLTLAETLDIAIQMSSALAAAHGAGIVHRDIKPANVMVRPDRIVKVLDFGLAKLAPSVAWAPGGPTVSMPATEPGSLVGTADYMSPEQARGQDVDARTDVWALGAVLYEMAAGRRPFQGATRADVLAAVLQGEPPSLADVQPEPPIELQRIVGKALRKNPDQRYQVMHDLLLDLEALRDDIDRRESRRHRDHRAGEGRLTRLRPRRGAFGAMAGLLAGAGAGWLVGTAPWRKAEPRPPQRLSIELGIDGGLAATDAPLALSRDGTLLAFVARPAGGNPLLYVRRLDQLAATPLSGTDGASSPCFSPDRQWIAFFADSKLKKVAVTGGAVVTLADAPVPRGASWADDGTIVFAPDYRMGLMRVSSAGGPAVPLTTLAGGEISHRFPQMLPGGRAVLYTASTEVNIGLGATLVVQPLPSGPRVVVNRGGYFGRYTSSGHILYVHGDTVYMVPFDSRRLQPTGPAQPTIDRVQADLARGSAQLALSETGTLAYVAGRNKFGPRPIAWMARTGALTSMRTDVAEWGDPEFSPDGRRIAVDIREAGQSDIWVYDWTRDMLTRVTTDRTNEDFPVWTPDGARLTYRTFTSSTDPAGYTIVWKRADGAGAAEALIHSRVPLLPGSWHPSGRFLAYTAGRPNSEDVMILPLEGDEVGGWKPGTPTPVLNGPARERSPAFSPDGRWLSYSSNESGNDQVFVQPFPASGPPVTVSVAIGHSAIWSRTRPEIVYMSYGLDYRYVLMAARYSVAAGAFRVEKPHPWAGRAPILRELLGSRMFALHPDGLRVAMAPPDESETIPPTHITLVLDAPVTSINGSWKPGDPDGARRLP